MFDRDKWQEIFATMRKHKLRTGLTALGVFWGIFMLIFVLGMGQGLQNGVFRGFGNRAKNIMFVWSTRTSEPYKGFQPGRYPRLTFDDIVAIKDNVPEVEYVSPRLTLGNSPIYFKDKGDVYQVRGELSDMIQAGSFKNFMLGGTLMKNDIKESRKVTVIGTRVKEVLFW